MLRVTLSSSDFLPVSHQVVLTQVFLGMRLGVRRADVTEGDHACDDSPVVHFAPAAAHGDVGDALGTATWTCDAWIMVPLYIVALLYLIGSTRRFWQGPSLGWDFGGDGPLTMMLVYRLPRRSISDRRIGLFRWRLWNDSVDGT
jgi:hypothetical protein